MVESLKEKVKNYKRKLEEKKPSGRYTLLHVLECFILYDCDIDWCEEYCRDYKGCGLYLKSVLNGINEKPPYSYD